MNVGALFAGIGGFELGLERAGFETSWQVEIDPYCRGVLERHFPAAERFEDVREVGARDLAPVDVICGGFPCQDLSVAGKGAGIDGARSGLWSEFARIIRELRPRYVLVENVPGLLTGKGKRWDRAPVGRVLGDLAEIGYDAEWACLSAGEFGAPHLRRRVWIVAYPVGAGTGVEEHRGGRQGREPAEPPEPALLRQEDRKGGSEGPHPGRADVADPTRHATAWSTSMPGAERQRARPCGAPGRAGRPADAERPGRTQQRRSEPAPASLAAAECPGWWSSEPGVGRVADGVPDRVDRLAALGNALVPQIAEWIGRRILEHEAATMRPAAEVGAFRPHFRPDFLTHFREVSRAPATIPHHDGDRGGPRKLRSPRHPEVSHES